MSNLFQELRRRNVIRVTGVYVVVGWLLAQVATTLEEALGLPVWFDGLIVALLLLGLPVAIVLAWAFELTPEGVVREQAGDEDAPPTPVRALDYAILIAVVALIGTVVWQQLGSQTSAAVEIVDAVGKETITDSSIAVLPFADLSPQGDQAYFAEGIAEEILNVLVRVDGLDVVSRTSSFQFRNEELGVPEIAAQLGVRHVLEGSVRKAGNVLRITAQLIDTEDDYHAWSQTYDRPLTAENVFEIQDDIATSIVAALGDVIGIEKAKSVQVETLTGDLDAYERYLRARVLVQGRINLEVAEADLLRAVELDPSFAEAWELLAVASYLKFDYGFTGPADSRDAVALGYADKALQLKTDSAVALALRALIRSNSAEVAGGKVPWAENIADLTRAIEIDPRNTEALNWRGLAYADLGLVDEAIADFAACIESERFYSACIENHYSMLASAGRDDEAMVAYEESLSKGMVKPYYAELMLLARRGEKLAFLSATNDARLLYGWHKHGELYDALRNLDQDHTALTDSILRFNEVNPRPDFDVLSAFLVPLGRHELRPFGAFIWGPAYRRYRASDEFKRYARETGMLDYWLAEGFPPQCRSVGDVDFSCID